jgi:general secretion pathway protein A
MYTNHFGFREKPFNVTPDPRFVYMNPAFKEAYASLLSGIRERKGFVVLTGEVGTGKTTLLRVLMKNLEATVRFVYFYNTTLSFEELLTYACEELGLETGSGGRLKKIQALNDFLIDQLRRGGTAALLIDEAQHLSEHVLENLRLLSNLETATEKLLQIVLVGQPELGAKLAQPSLRQLKQRVSVQCRIDRLKDREIPTYIQFRLESVGGQHKDLFGRRAMERITHYSGGIPRLINIICDNALTIAYATSQKTITAEVIEEVAEDLRLTNGAPEPPARSESHAEGAAIPAGWSPERPVPPVTTPAVAAPLVDAEAPAERPTEPRLPAAARRERRRPRSLGPLWMTGGAVAAAALLGIGISNSSRLTEAAGTVGAAGRDAVTVVTAQAAQAWHGLASQVGSLTASPNGVAGSGTAEITGRPVDTGAGPAASPAVAPPSSPVATPPVPAPIPSPRPVTVPERAASAAPAAPAVPVAPAPMAPATPEPSRTSPAAPALTPPPPMPRVEPATTPVPPPSRVAAVPGERRITSAPAAPARSVDQRPVVIPQGGTVSDIAFRTYGHYSTLAVDLIKEFNPHIADLDWIRTGDRLWLPPLTRETMTRPQADGSYRLILGSFLSPVAAARLGDAIRRRGLDAHVTPRQVTGQLTLYRVEIAGVTTRDAAEGIWRTALANCWIFISDAPCERTNP